MTKITLNDISGLGTTGSLVNQNNDILETFSNTVLSRNGTAPNQMEADLDMNSNRILNLAAPLTATDAVRLKDLTNLAVITESDLALLNNGYVFNSLQEAAETDIPAIVVAVRTFGYASAGDRGGALYKRVGTEPAHEGKFQSTDGDWWELAEDRPNIVMFGAVEGVDCSGAILAAIEYLRANEHDVGFNIYTSGTIRFPRGEWIVDHSTLELAGDLHVTFEGEGSRNCVYFQRAPTSLVIDGTGSTSSSFGIKLDFNGARNFRIRDMAVEYSNSFAGDLILAASSAGLFAENVWFGSSSINASVGSRPYTCANLIHAYEGHHYSLINCSFADADIGIYIDGVTASNAFQWNISGCMFYDFTTAPIYDTGSTGYGISITGCVFDPVLSSSTYGVVINSPGFSITGCGFVGSSLSTGPTDSWIYMSGQNGQGLISGNYFASQVDGSYVLKMEGGFADFRANKAICSQGIKTTGIVKFTGANNYFSHSSASGSTTDIACDLGHTAGYTHFGPNWISTEYQNSYQIAGNTGFVSGVIFYSNVFDQSANGPTFTNAGGSVRLETTDISTSSDVARQLTLRDTGKKFISAGTWTLPVTTGSAGGIKLHFLKSTSSTITINCPASAFICDGSGSPKTSIANSTSEVGSMITLESSNDGLWWVTNKTGTWS